MRRLLLSLLILALALPAIAQAKHPFTFEDMMKLKRVGDPQISPDGKWVIFSVVDVDLEANSKTPHIWIVPLIHGPCGDGRPRPSGRAKLGRLFLSRTDPHRRSRRRPPALGAGWEALRVPVEQRRTGRKFGSQTSMARAGQ